MFWTFFWKDKLCSFCELPAWWKCTQRPLLTKMRDFENSEASKTWKGKLYSFCKLPAWWKCTQTHLLTKVRDFERFEVAKTWKGKLCEKLLNLRTLQFFFLLFFETYPCKFKKNDIQKKWPFARQHKNDPKKMSIYLEKKNHIFEKSPLHLMLCDFTLLTIIEHAFTKKNIDEITILHRNFVCFSIFFIITICKPNLICQKCVKSDTKYHCKIIFFFFCKITIYTANLGNKNVYC